MHKPRNEGGCWFCEDDAGEMRFSVEFDCYVDEACILKEITEEWFNPEALIMAREFELPVVKGTNNG